MKKLIILCLLITLVNALQAQRGKQKAPLYGENAYQHRGWMFAPGITLSPSLTGNRFEILRGEGEQRNDTIYAGRFNPGSSIGLYAEVGRHKFVENFYILKHFDYGVHFKMIRGKERFVGQVSNGSQLIETTNNARFSESFAGAFINASNVAQLSSNTWLHNSLGLNLDYRVISNRTAEGFYGEIPQSFPDPLLVQLHYKLGFGWKADAGLFFMPTIETPILNLYPTLDGKSTLNYFSSEHRVFIISLRVMFLDKTEGRKCVGKDTSGSKPQLWGKEMRKYNR